MRFWSRLAACELQRKEKTTGKRQRKHGDDDSGDEVKNKKIDTKKNKEGIMAALWILLPTRFRRRRALFFIRIVVVLFGGWGVAPALFSNARVGDKWKSVFGHKPRRVLGIRSSFWCPFQPLNLWCSVFVFN